MTSDMNEQLMSDLEELEDREIERIQDVSHYAAFPYSIFDRNDPSKELLTLAEQFRNYLQAFTTEDQLKIVDDIPIPLELEPHYLCLILHYTDVPHLFLNPDMRGLAANGLSPDAKPYIIRSFIHNKYSFTTPRNHQSLIFEWRLCNRFMDPIPLGSFGATQLLDIRKMTPQLAKELMKWNMTAEGTSYKVTHPENGEATQTVKLWQPRPTKLAFLRDMFKVFAPNADDSSYSSDIPRHEFAHQVLDTAMSKLMIKIIMNSKMDNVSNTAKSNIHLAFSDLTCLAPYFRLLPGKIEETVPVGL